jgi:hypothetical protein
MPTVFGDFSGQIAPCHNSWLLTTQIRATT